jgi:hypothetical protein
MVIYADRLAEQEKIVTDLKISVIKFNTISKLITSDFPLIVLNAFCMGNGGLGIAGVFIIIPISTDKIIVIYDNKMYKNLPLYSTNTNQEDVLTLNKIQILNAEDRIIANCNGDLLQNISNEILSERIEFLKKEKVTKAKGLNNINFSRIPYKFSLSFCDLIKTARNIPADCREPMSRIYKEEFWKKLIFSAYILPDLLKKNDDFPKSLLKERKEGYKKMLHYMEHYWELPAEKRQVTPDLLKSFSSKYFPVDKKLDI